MLVHFAISIIALSRTPLKISNLNATTGMFLVICYKLSNYFIEISSNEV